MAKVFERRMQIFTADKHGAFYFPKGLLAFVHGELEFISVANIEKLDQPLPAIRVLNGNIMFQIIFLHTMHRRSGDIANKPRSRVSIKLIEIEL